MNVEVGGEPKSQESKIKPERLRIREGARERAGERVVKSYQKLFDIPEPRDGAFVSLTWAPYECDSGDKELITATISKSKEKHNIYRQPKTTMAQNAQS